VEAARDVDSKKAATLAKHEKRRRVFARHIWQGMDPFDAFVKAEYPVAGFNVPRGGYTPEQAANKAAAMRQEWWCRELLRQWDATPDDALEASLTDAAEVFALAMRERDEFGIPTNKALRAAENVMDRRGYGRSQIIERGPGTSGNHKDREALIAAIKTSLAALEAPVTRPAELECILVESTRVEPDGEPS
jgi:hypothetical protein